MATSWKFVTPVVRASYAFVFEPRPAKKPGDKQKYGVSLIFDKKYENARDQKLLEEIQKGITALATDVYGPEAPKLLAKGKLHNPLRDGDEDRSEEEAYKGRLFMNANSDRQPGIVDARLVPIIDEEEMYSGCYIRASISLFPFDVDGKKGIGCGLNNIQVVKKGERLDGRKKAEEDFKEFAEEGGGESKGDLDDME